MAVYPVFICAQRMVESCIMTNERQQHWDEKWSQKRNGASAVCHWLVKYQDQLAGGQALDVACGLGQNAIWLAQRGFEVDAADISPVALARAQVEAERAGVQINFIQTDLNNAIWPVNTYNVIVVRRFLERSLWPVLRQALAPGGWLFYETFNQRKHITQRDFPDAFLLEDGELTQAFSRLRIIEAGDQGGEHEEVSWIVCRK